jgi:hypothetical protein
VAEDVARLELSTLAVIGLPIGLGLLMLAERMQKSEVPEGRPWMETRMLPPLELIAYGDTEVI